MNLIELYRKISAHNSAHLDPTLYIYIRKKWGRVASLLFPSIYIFINIVLDVFKAVQLSKYINKISAHNSAHVPHTLKIVCGFELSSAFSKDIQIAIARQSLTGIEEICAKYLKMKREYFLSRK